MTVIIFKNRLPVFAAMFSRRKSPLDRCFRPKLCAILSDMVPFPDPGGPMITARNNLAISTAKYLAHVGINLGYKIKRFEI